MSQERLAVTDKLLELRPANAAKRLPAGSKACLLNGHDIFRVLKEEPVIIMACNTRIKHVIPGIMRAAQELDAVISFELARSESDHLGKGYTGMTPRMYFDTVLEYADATGFDRPFFLHADHITVKKLDEAYLQETKDLIAAQLEAGYTCFAVDASFNENPKNAELTEMLSEPIRAAGLGLEVEVGEIKGTGTDASLTTVEEATDYIERLQAAGITPDLLAINNGSKHGNYLEGEEINIDLERTGKIYEAIKKYGICIAQHGITGTPLNVVGRFADYGIRKGNVGTHWQNIAHACLPEGLMSDMKSWCESEGKNIKMATKPFKDKIDAVDQGCCETIAQRAYETAKDYIEAFRAPGTASKVIKALG